ncbi:MAG: ABC transporter permease subunit, partial [Clostridia bacterium]
YNVIIARTFMTANIPEELSEAASIDGCNTTRFFFRMVLPLSPALIAVLVLFNAVGQWNSWFNAMIYLRDQSQMPLQMVLRDLIISQSTMMNEMGMEAQGDDFAQQAMLAESMKYAVIIVSTLPILALYPFIQKYFVKGVMVGSIKG